MLCRRGKCIERKTACGLLVGQGFLNTPRKAATDMATFRQSIMVYQGFHGLAVTGDVDSITERHLQLPRFCGLPDFFLTTSQEDLDATGPAKWNAQPISWWLARAFPGFSLATSKQIVALAFSQWAAVADLRFVEASTSAACQILMNVGVIDGPSNVLAWSRLPGAGIKQVDQLYDSAESWVRSAAPKPAEIDILAVISHEIGHALGAPHLATGNLMAAIYDPAIQGPRQGDAAFMSNLYGVPDTPPPPDPAMRSYLIQFPRAVRQILVEPTAA